MKLIDIFSNDFPVYTHYIMGDNAILSNSSIFRKSYMPITHRELPSEIAKLNDKNIKSLLMFCKRYGDFGYEDNIEEINFSPKIDWIWSHVNTVQFILTLAFHLQQKDERNIKRTIMKYCDYNSTNHKINFSTSVKFKASIKSWSYNEDLSFLAHQILNDIVNENISSVKRIVNMKKDGIFKKTFIFETLFEVTYWLILDAVEKCEIRKCDQCNIPFIINNKRQKFCPKLEFQSESNCALLYRQRKRLEKLEENVD
ncbi:hypothetical protein [Priestia megaterium]|uniref:hypothetical protein n=1 Tax=Priestia megaterium TaxID=1404 RepID=UPI003D276A04